MLSDGKITEIFCMVDDFCKFFNETVKRHTLEENDGKKHRNKLSSAIACQFRGREVKRFSARVSGAAKRGGDVLHPTLRYRLCGVNCTSCVLPLRGFDYSCM